MSRTTKDVIRRGRWLLVAFFSAALSFGMADDDDYETTRAVFERPVSLEATNLPLRDALQQLAEAAGLKLQLDVAALTDAEFDLSQRVTMTIRNETLSDALMLMIDWNDYPGVFREYRNGELVVTTMAASQRGMEAALPETLRPLYRRGLAGWVNQQAEITSLAAGNVLTDDHLASMAILPKLRKLNLGASQLTAEGLAALSRMTSLESLTLSGLRNGEQWLGDAALSQLAGLKSLRSLSINECGATDAGIQFVAKMPSLTQLSIYQEGRLTDAALPVIATLKNLKSLSLNSYGGTVELGRMEFSQEATKALAGLSQLEHLHLVGQEIAAETLQFPNLKSLSLGEIGVNDAHAQRIADCSRLTSLHLHFTGITDDGLRHLSDLSELRRLDIDSAIISDEGIWFLRKFDKLKHVSLRAPNLSDDSLETLATIKSLERIDLNGSGRPGVQPGRCFTIEGLLHFKSLPRLRTLWLDNLETGGGYVELKKLSQLRELSLQMADIRLDEFEALEDAMPKTRLTHMTGGGGFSTLPKKKRSR